ncbi:MAG: DUF1189 family protein [Pseudomonadota bacterium]|nr:DUF1189 family protein [Pseudomonadota bacterium]
MDTLTRYIQQGKKLTGGKLFLIFIILTILTVGCVGGRLYHKLSEPDMQNFLAEFPSIEIENGVIISPDKTIWEKKLADNQFLFQIDTTQNTAKTLPKNGIVLTKKQVILSYNGQEKAYPLPPEKVVINKTVLEQFFQIVIVNTCVFIGIMLFIILLLGQASTTILSAGLLWLFKTDVNSDSRRRASFIGWLSVLALNIGLRFAGYGFSLLGCVGIATLISVFCLMWAKNKD